MTQYKNILLSTDGSEFSEGAVREAIRLSKRFSSKLYIMNVIGTNPEFEALAPDIIEKLEIKAREYLIDVRNRAEKEGVVCETIVHQGEDTYRFIIDEAAKRNAGLIVMGRRGRTGLMRLMMGSVTARTIGHSPVDVMVVPKKAVVELKNIVIATDASGYSEIAEKKAIEIAETAGANLFAVAVTRPDAVESRIKESDNALMRIKMSAEKKGIKMKTQHIKNIPHEKIYEAITEFAKNNGADLIVVGSHGRTGIAKLLMGSVAERVIGHSDCAVLVVKS